MARRKKRQSKPRAATVRAKSKEGHVALQALREHHKESRRNAADAQRRAQKANSRVKSVERAISGASASSAPKKPKLPMKKQSGGQKSGGGFSFF